MLAFRSRVAAPLRKMSSASHTLLLENMNPCIKRMEYAVRGPLVIRATEIEKVSQAILYKLGTGTCRYWYDAYRTEVLLYLSVSN